MFCDKLNIVMVGEKGLRIWVKLTEGKKRGSLIRGCVCGCMCVCVSG